MRIAILGGPLLLLSACDTLPAGKVEVDLGNRTVTAGNCTCGMPAKPPVATPTTPAAAANDLRPR